MPTSSHSTPATLSIFAPGGYEPLSARMATASRYFEARGWRVELLMADHERHGRFSGTDAERLRWLARACDTPDGGVAIALRGGYGATRLLPAIDFAALAAAAARGVRFVGHSDFTAISLGLLATTGAPSLAGPLATFGFGRETVDPFTEEHFWQAIDAHRVDVTFETACSGDCRAQGMLWGGNLAMLTSLVGTPWMPTIDDGILFVEDVNEQPYRIERMLLQLAQAGILNRQRLVLCGDFTGWKATDYDAGYDLDAALARVQETTTVPIVRGLPFGHGERIATLGVGTSADVEIVAGRCRLTQRLA
jgi:muramoyltetrapeptide carboxypeptidase